MSGQKIRIVKKNDEFPEYQGGRYFLEIDKVPGMAE